MDQPRRDSDEQRLPLVSGEPHRDRKGGLPQHEALWQPPADVLPPASAIATQAASGIAASVVQAAGQWPEGNTEGASAFQSGIRSQLNYCPGVGDVISVDLRPAPSWYGFAATLLVGKERDNPTSEVHIYNVVPPESGTVSELAVTVPRTGREPSPWKPVDDATVLRALAQPLCKGSC
ncbi:Uncharacterised protein [Mycobacteroides abscessus]|nr:Uncharacterised protein [Mycobacteroides abscessus]